MNTSGRITGASWLWGFGAVVLLAGCGGSDDGDPRFGTGGTGGFSGTGGFESTAGFAGSGGFGGGIAGSSGFGGTGGFAGSGGIGGSGGFGGGVAGSGGFGGSGGFAGSSGFAGSAGIGGVGGMPAALPPCVTAPSEVVIIGDSYVTGALSPQLQPALAALYPAAGQFRNYAVAGTSMATGGITGLIPPQLETAIAVNPSIKLAIMDGGGNDILICDGLRFPGCSTACNTSGSSTRQVCRDIVDLALTAADQLMSRAADAGVRDTIYFYYPHIPASNGGYSEILDYAEPLARQKCEGAAANTAGRLRCHFVSLIEPFRAAGGDMNPLNFAGDGIHPSQAGQEIMAREIWNVMQSQCLGQTASSGCCMP